MLTQATAAIASLRHSSIFLHYTVAPKAPGMPHTRVRGFMSADTAQATATRVPVRTD
jgi:hypothetical protein